MFYSMGIFMTSSPGDIITNSPGRDALRRQEEEPGYTEILQQMAGSLNIKTLLLIKENHISQVKEFNTYFTYGKMQESGLTETFHRTSPIWKPACCVFQIVDFLSSGFPIGSSCSLMVAQFSSVGQSCPTTFDPMDCSMPGFPINHQLPELTQSHVHLVSDTIQPSHPLPSPSLPAFNLSQHEGLFQCVSSSHQVESVLEFQLQHQSFQ